MQDYLFIGSEERFYPFLADLGRSLTAEPGDIVAFENPPTDGLWLPMKASKSKSLSKTEAGE